MPDAKPFIGRMQVVESQWTDYNGHLNMAFYAVLFDRAADEMFETFGTGADYVKRTNCTTFTLETHTSYANELKQGEMVRVETQIIAHDKKRVHYVQQMFRGDSGYLACVLEVMVSHVDLNSHRTSAFPDEILARISTMALEHAKLPIEAGLRIRRLEAQFVIRRLRLFCLVIDAREEPRRRSVDGRVVVECRIPRIPLETVVPTKVGNRRQ